MTILNEYPRGTVGSFRNLDSIRFQIQHPVGIRVNKLYVVAIAEGSWKHDDISVISAGVIDDAFVGYLAYVGANPLDMDVVITGWPKVFESGVPRKWRFDVTVLYVVI